MKVIDYPSDNKIAETYCRSEIVDKNAITYRGVTITYGQMHKAVLLCAQDLQKRGVKKGDIVALWGYSCIEWMVCLFAIVRLGAKPVLLSHGLPLRKLLVDLHLVKPSFLVVGNNSVLKQNGEALGILTAELGLDDCVYTFGGMRIFERLEAGEQVNEEDFPDMSESNCLALFMTSGSTGVPKVVQVPQDGFMKTSRGCAIITKPFSDESLVLGLPLFHVYGLNVMICMLGCGQHVTIPDNLKPPSINKAIIEAQAPSLCTVGALMCGMILDPDFKTAAQYLRFAVMGGGSTPPRATHILDKHFPEIILTNGYGLTETCGAITLSYPTDSWEKRIDTVGTLFPEVEMRIVGPEGEQKETGDRGEILIKGPMVMTGYCDIPAEMQPFDKDGWFYTGDLGYFDKDGYLHFAGRLKDIIVRCGENVVPGDLETALLASGIAAEAKVIGVATDNSDELIVAAVTPATSQELTIDVVREALAAYVPNAWLPDMLVVVEQMPRTATGKIDGLAVERIFRERFK